MTKITPHFSYSHQSSCSLRTLVPSLLSSRLVRTPLKLLIAGTRNSQVYGAFLYFFEHLNVDCSF